MNELISTYLPIAIALVGIMAFVVSVITEVTKKIPFLAKIPTDIVVICLSIVFSVVAYLVYAQCMLIVVTWYMVAAAIIAGFFVAFIAMFGWDKMDNLWQRFKK